MKKSIVVALGTSDPRVVAAVQKATQVLSSETAASWDVHFRVAATSTEKLATIESLTKEACLRAQLLRLNTNAELGVAMASGVVPVLYNRGARRARFDAHVIAAVMKGMPLLLAFPNGSPEDAFPESERIFRRLCRGMLPETDVSDPDLDNLAELAVRTWMETIRGFAEPEIELLH